MCYGLHCLYEVGEPSCKLLQEVSSERHIQVIRSLITLYVK